MGKLKESKKLRRRIKRAKFVLRALKDKIKVERERLRNVVDVLTFSEQVVT